MKLTASGSGEIFCGKQVTTYNRFLLAFSDTKKDAEPSGEGDGGEDHGEEAKEDDEEPLATPLDDKPADPLAAADPDEKGNLDEEEDDDNDDDDKEDEEEDDEADEYLKKFVNKGKEVN